MIPYIIINNVCSKTINGLLIQNLPPISKPKIRTSKEEIDGRDGDIITTLGYSAYDKVIEIGLKGDYNVDDVISYFDTEGIITFSNELDKYYNFKVYDTIDFERLIRFKTASVKLHIQPFKYDANEVEKVLNYDGTYLSDILNIRNLGNIYSKPILTITGKGEVTVRLNNNLILIINLNALNTQTIVIDTENMNAYDLQGNYLNRIVNGDYSNLKLNVGINRLAIQGKLSQVKINKVSRWI